jgi:hypothetical protein
MAGISFRICGICLLVGSLLVVESQAQRSGGSGRTPAERRSGAPLDPTQPSGTQPQATTPGAIPPQPAGGSTAGGSQPPQQPTPQQFPGRNPGFTPQPAPSRPPVQPTADADTDPVTGQPTTPAGQPARTAPGMTPGQQRPTPTKSAAVVGAPTVQPPPVKASTSVATGAPAANTPFIGPQMPLPAGPVPPEKQAPTPPRITFQNGLLTLESTNSRLADVLNGVRTKANIQFEGLDPAPERVAIKLGPAPADEVLASLLQGSRFDYVILGHPDDPHSVVRVLLTAKTGSPMAAMGNQAPVKQPQPAEEEEEATEEQTVEQPQQPAQNQQPGPAMLQQPAPSASGVQTPEQMLERLNRLKEEQQKQAGQGAVQQPNNTAPLKRPLPQ